MRQGSCEVKYSVLSFCLSDNKNPVSLLLIFNLRCWSNYGKVGGGQTISVMKGGCMWKGIIQHELDHALGFLHEHSRSDRDKYVRIMWEYISPGKYFWLPLYRQWSRHIILFPALPCSLKWVYKRTLIQYLILQLTDQTSRNLKTPTISVFPMTILQ